MLFRSESDTTSASRIFIKFLFQELTEWLGLAKLKARLVEDETSAWVAGLFPSDTPRNMRFAINFFVSCGLGALTDGLRALLKQLPQLLALREEEARRQRKEERKRKREQKRRRRRRKKSGSESSSGSSSVGRSCIVVEWYSNCAFHDGIVATCSRTPNRSRGGLTGEKSVYDP